MERGMPSSMGGNLDQGKVGNDLVKEEGGGNLDQGEGGALIKEHKNDKKAD